MSETPPGGPTGGLPTGDGENALEFRDPEKARAIADTLAEIGEELEDPPATVMHVCGSHEQSIAKFGIRSMLPDTVRLIMGPGCPVCITDMPEVDEAVALAESGVTVATYGDMLKVPGTSKSLDDARAAGADVRIIYSAGDVVEIAEEEDGEVVFFATGFETTAAPTAAVVLSDPPPNLSILSAHKYVPPAMEIVAEMPDTDIQGYLAAGNAAIITGSGIFEELAERHELPVVVGGFEPLDILAGVTRLVEMIRDGEAGVENAYPRCVTREGNEPAQEQLWEVFEGVSGQWRGIADIPDANLVLRGEYAEYDARERFEIDTASLADAGATGLADDCICGDIMSGTAEPTDCEMFGEECTPDDPVGACMVSSEGTCKIWHEYGGRPDI
ncbi:MULTISPECIES: hydrogenase formation protein HypD [Natrialbaceae]|uniref:hydrogenase formation protein HypD n=1 Tax=Natrialbaceae TaxID=1644061 RepID=UPI00207C1A25|nr:hydrogenase formation protein HypD [Natronococcus sp. CG52]